MLGTTLVDPGLRNRLIMCSANFLIWVEGWPQYIVYLLSSDARLCLSHGSGPLEFYAGRLSSLCILGDTRPWWEEAALSHTLNTWDFKAKNKWEALSSPWWFVAAGLEACGWCGVTPHCLRAHCFYSDFWTLGTSPPLSQDEQPSLLMSC